jgi:hypothetical protein
MSKAHWLYSRKELCEVEIKDAYGIFLVAAQAYKEVAHSYSKIWLWNILIFLPKLVALK